MRQLLNGIYAGSGWLAAVCVALICLIITVQVILNLVDRLMLFATGTAIGLTIPSYADFTGFLLVAASFLALAPTFRVGGHIRVTLITQKLSPAAARVLDIWCLVLAIGLLVALVWYLAGLIHESIIYNDLSSGMVPVPLWIPQAPMLLGVIIMTIALLDDLGVVLTSETPSYAGHEGGLLNDPSPDAIASGAAE